MLIASMRGNQQRVALLIVQEHQSATSQDFSRPPNQPTWDERIGIDGLAVTIDVKDGSKVLSPRCVFLPQRSGPTCERFCERRIRSNRGQFGQKSLGMAIAVGHAPTCEEC